MAHQHILPPSHAGIEFHFLGNRRPLLQSVTNSTGATQRFSDNRKTSSEQKHKSSFISDQSQMRVKSDAKGNVKVDCDASIYSEMLFIFITKEADWRRPKNFKKQTKKLYIYEPNVPLECSIRIQRQYVYRMAAWKSSTSIAIFTVHKQLF